MGVFSRLSDIINSNINAMLDKAEDPEKIIRLIIQEMEDTLVEVRSAAARSIADKKEMVRRIDTISREREEWQRRAELAVSKGRDDLAKAALAEKKCAADTLAVLEEQRAHAETGLAKLNDDIAALQDKLADARNRQKSLELRHKTAAERLKVRSRIHDERIHDAMGRFESYERKMEHLEGKVEAFDLGRNSGLNQAFSELETDEHVADELAALKRRMDAQQNDDAREQE